MPNIATLDTRPSAPPAESTKRDSGTERISLLQRLKNKITKRARDKAVSHVITATQTASSAHDALRTIAMPSSGPTISRSDSRPDHGGGHSREDSFARNQREFAAKHSDEVKPLETGPFAVAVVSRAYRELSNGNLTERLTSLASQEVPSREVRAYIAVNNVRLLAVAADVWDRDQVTLQALPDTQRRQRMKELISEEYQRRGINMESDEQGSINDYKAPIEKRIRDYRENQATLSVLRALTVAVNALSVQPNASHSEITSQALEQIRQASVGFMTEAQLQALLLASQAIMKRRIFIMGVDCSSFSKGYLRTNHGQATNEAAHLAIAQGAKYIDVSDMDEFHGPTALQEVVTLARTNKVDVLIRPLQVVVPQHPEQLRDSTHLWADLVHYYSSSLTDAQESYGRLSTLSSGSQIVSARAFMRHEYPHLGMNEDFAYARTMRDDPTLVKRYALRSDLRLANRGRDVSWDGSGLGYRSLYDTVETLRGSTEPAQKTRIENLVRDDVDLRGGLNNARKKHRGLPDYSKLYLEQRRQFFERNQEERVRLRRLFLGVRRNGLIASNGILPSVYRVWSLHQEWSAEQIIQATKLRPRQRAFLDQNPLLLKGALQELQRIQRVSKRSLSYPPDIHTLPKIFASGASEGILPLSSAIQHIVNSLPELFGVPLATEPSYDQAEIDKMPSEEINPANWMHLAQVRNWFRSYITNLDRDRELPSKARNELIAAAGGTI